MTMETTKRCDVQKENDLADGRFFIVNLLDGNFQQT